MGVVLDYSPVPKARSRVVCWDIHDDPPQPWGTAAELGEQGEEPPSALGERGWSLHQPWGTGAELGEQGEEPPSALGDRGRSLHQPWGTGAEPPSALGNRGGAWGTGAEPPSALGNRGGAWRTGAEPGGHGRSLHQLWGTGGGASISPGTWLITNRMSPVCHSTAPGTHNVCFSMVTSVTLDYYILYSYDKLSSSFQNVCVAMTPPHATWAAYWTPPDLVEFDNNDTRDGPCILPCRSL